MRKLVKSNIKETLIPGLLVIERPTYKDSRGFFREILRLNELEKAINGKFRFKQWSHSFSKPRVIRALHSEDQNKIICPLTGEMFAAFVDVRPRSKSFGRVATLVFKEPNYKAMFIPKGVANSICVIGEDPVHYLYLIDAYYDKEKTKGIAWNDPDLNINWPIRNPILSDRDKQNPSLRELFPEKFK